MILVNNQHIDQVKYLVQQSSMGNHILFDNDTIKKISNTKEFSKEKLVRAEELTEQMILCPSIEEKKTYLSKLSKEEYESVARVYMRMVHNATQTTKSMLH